MPGSLIQQVKADHQPHSHRFVNVRKDNERRTMIVVILTVITMVAEIIAGIFTGSMALLSDGWHMGTHAGALGIALFAYVYSRRNADQRRYTFGTGKVGVLAAFTSAIILGLTGILIFYESLIVQTASTRFSLYETFDIGLDRCTPVVGDYLDKMPFAYPGKIEKLVIELGERK